MCFDLAPKPRDKQLRLLSWSCRPLFSESVVCVRSRPFPPCTEIPSLFRLLTVFTTILVNHCQTDFADFTVRLFTFCLYICRCFGEKIEQHRNMPKNSPALAFRAPDKIKLKNMRNERSRKKAAVRSYILFGRLSMKIFVIRPYTVFFYNWICDLKKCAGGYKINTAVIFSV